MATKKYTGNQFSHSDLIRVLLQLKTITISSIKVAEVCKVVNINNNEIRCLTINTNETIYCNKLQDLVLQKNDIVLVIFTDTDFRQNLEKIKKEATTQIIDSKTNLHQISFGIVVGLIYRKEV